MNGLAVPRAEYAKVGVMGHFKDLKAWQHARSLAVLSRAAIARLPESESAALADQWRRGAYRVVLNIAAGGKRPGEEGVRRFPDIPRRFLHRIAGVPQLALAP